MGAPLYLLTGATADLITILSEGVEIAFVFGLKSAANGLFEGVLFRSFRTKQTSGASTVQSRCRACHPDE